MNLLIKRGVLKNTHLGYTDVRTGARVGYYRTHSSARKMYIEDSYADKAKILTKSI